MISRLELITSEEYWIETLETLQKSGKTTIQIATVISNKMKEALTTPEAVKPKDCGNLHSTDWNGKCFKCGEQVFIREQKDKNCDYWL